MSESLRDVLLQEVRARFPKIDWRLGSVVRELVIEPLAKLGDILDSKISKSKASLDVRNICSSPTQYEEELDAWMERLGLTPPEKTTSSGTVRIMRTNPEDLTIVEGTQFTWNGEIVVYAKDTYTITSDVSRVKDPRTIIYKNYNDSAYSADIPVECSSFSGGSISSGSPINWGEAPEDVYDIYVGSAISGGSSSLSPAEKARMISDALTPDMLSGERCIRKALRRNFPDFVKDVVTGDKDVNKPYAVSLYIKPVNCLSEYSIPLSVVHGVGKLPGCGVYSVTGVYTKEGTAVNADVVYPANLGDSGSEISIELPTYISANDECFAEVVGFPEYSSLDSWLKGATAATPYEFNLKTPAVGIVSIYSSVDGVEYTGARSEIAQLISDTDINGSVSDNDLDKILNKYNTTITKPSAYSISVHYKSYKTTHTTFRSVSVDPIRHAISAPLILYSQDNLIEVSSD